MTCEIRQSATKVNEADLTAVAAHRLEDALLSWRCAFEAIVEEREIKLVEVRRLDGRRGLDVESCS